MYDTRSYHVSFRGKCWNSALENHFHNSALVCSFCLVFGGRGLMGACVCGGGEGSEGGGGGGGGGEVHYN